MNDTSLSGSLTRLNAARQLQEKNVKAARRLYF